MICTGQVKEWIKKEYEEAKQYSFTVSGVKSAMDRSFGVLMFATNELFGYESSEGQELEKWWDEEIRNKFWELMLKKQKGE